MAHKFYTVAIESPNDILLKKFAENPHFYKQIADTKQWVVVDGKIDGSRIIELFNYLKEKCGAISVFIGNPDKGKQRLILSHGELSQTFVK